MKEIAKAMGICRATVSRALRNSSLVRHELRIKIQQTAHAMGYRSDPRLSELMTHLRAGRSHTELETLAYVTSTQYEDFVKRGKSLAGQHLQHFQGAREKGNALGFQIEVFHLGDYGFNGTRLSNVLWNRGIRGVLVSMLELQHSRLDFNWSRFSAIGTSLRLFEPYLHRVCHHHFHGMRTAYRKLWDKGYRRIGFASSLENDVASDHGWKASYLNECDCRGRENLPRMLIDEELDSNILGKWIKKHDCDAVVFAPGLPILEMLGSLKYQVPDDIGVACLGVNSGDEKERGVAGIEQHPALLGGVAVSLIAGLIAQNEIGVPENPITHHVEGRWKDGTTLKEERPIL